MGASRNKKQDRLSFEYEVVEDDGSVTSYGGLPVLVDTMKGQGVEQAIRRHVDLGKRERPFDEVAAVEAFVLLFAAGGDCLDDIEVLREDKALCRLLEREMPSAETLRKFLYAFHDDQLIAAAQAGLSQGETSYVPQESEPLQGLAAVQTELVRAVLAHGRSKMATVDIDATVQQSRKREAKETYEGGRGYQPVIAYYSEQDLILADEFRDGNVPAGKDTVAICERAFAALPESITDRRLRADSAMYNTAQLKWLVDKGIKFTISADMTRELSAVCKQVKDEQWELLETRCDELVHITEVLFSPGHWPKSAPALRYLAVRFTPTQGELFDRGAGPKHLAVVTNREGPVAELLRWHWEKAGTVEHVHDVVKNELGGGVLPCGRFGANAAYFRLVLLTYNVISALKSIGLPPRLQDARPKRLRFEIFTLPAVVVNHARKLLARVMNRADRALGLVAARRCVLLPVPAT